jgi:hypothetical protein
MRMAVSQQMIICFSMEKEMCTRKGSTRMNLMEIGRDGVTG